MAVSQCEYCRRQLSCGEHHVDCPVIAHDPKAIAEWTKGYAYGMEDDFLHVWELPYYSPAFILGHRLGKGELDEIIERIQDRNYSYHRDEY